jgi:hypothetical protein
MEPAHLRLAAAAREKSGFGGSVRDLGIIARGCICVSTDDSDSDSDGQRASALHLNFS